MQLSDRKYIFCRIFKNKTCHILSSVHTELLAIALALAMQEWVENVAKECVEYPFLVMPSNANSIANAQCERTLTLSQSSVKTSWPH